MIVYVASIRWGERFLYRRFLAHDDDLAYVTLVSLMGGPDKDIVSIRRQDNGEAVWRNGERRYPSIMLGASTRPQERREALYGGR